MKRDGSQSPCNACSLTRPLTSVVLHTKESNYINTPASSHLLKGLQHSFLIVQEHLALVRRDIDIIAAHTAVPCQQTSALHTLTHITALTRLPQHVPGRRQLEIDDRHGP